MPIRGLENVKGQEHAKRAMEIAACGGFAVALIGAPGSGKTMLADCFSEYVPTVVEAWPCACGHFGNPAKECGCSPAEVKRVTKLLHSAIEDYSVALCVEMPSLRYRELATSRGEDGAVVSARIDKILAFRAEHPDTDERLSFDADSHRLMESVMDRLSFSARAVELVRRVARVIADMEGSMRIRVNHLSEAIQYRILERVL